MAVPVVSTPWTAEADAESVSEDVLDGLGLSDRKSFCGKLREIGAQEALAALEQQEVSARALSACASHSACLLFEKCLARSRRRSLFA